MKRILTFIIFICGISMAQTQEFADQLYNRYDNYKESSITSRKFKHQDILPLIEKLKENPLFLVSEAGHSAQGREIYLVSAGEGKSKIFMWSQMHGDEPTATMAIFDIFNFLSADDELNPVRKTILQNTSLYFMPMVNPDGAEVFKRRNSFDIDINRDASRNTTPEGKVLKEVYDYLKADIGFNLHDQSIYYSAGRAPRSAAISFLAPAAEFEKGIDSVRLNAMKLISHLHNILSDFIPGHIGRYNDDHEPRAFGDNFQKWGTSTILIETGGWKNDPEKQFLRKINFITLLSAIFSAADGSYKDADSAVYNKIPFNEELMKDLVLRNMNYEKDGVKITVDVSIDRIERPLNGNSEYQSAIDDIGDLSVFYGYEDYDFTGYEIFPGKVYTKRISSAAKLTDEFISSLLEEGYTNIIYDGNPKKLKGNYHINLTKDKNYNNRIAIGNNANFYLSRDGRIEYVFVNGFMYNVAYKVDGIQNSIIVR